MTRKTTFISGSKPLAWTFLLLFAVQIFAPLKVKASGGGPTQPEVQGFTPIGVSDMVDPFTGDFTYNIPLMDIEGYPINIAYNSGISMDQEASWVGLGWTLNTGSIVRNMRGLPDDFDGDNVEKTVSQKANTTIGLRGALDFELFGYKKPPGSSGGGDSAAGSLNLSVGLGIAYNNYNGFSSEFSISPSFKFTKYTSHSLSAGFSLSGSSENGASFSPSVSFEKTLKDKSTSERKLGGLIGSSYNSRAGLTELSYTATFKKSYTKTRTNSDGTTSKKNKYFEKGSDGSYDLGLQYYSPSAGPSMQNISISGSWKFSTSLFGADPSATVGVSYSRQWIPDDQKTFTNPAFGYLKLQNGQTNERALLDFNRDNDGSFTKYTPNLPSAHLTYDIFSVNAQGAGGSFRAYRNDIGYVFDPVTRTVNNIGGAGLEAGGGNLLKVGGDINYSNSSARTGAWTNKASNVVRFESASGILETAAFQEANEDAVDRDRLFVDQYYGSSAAFFPLAGIALAANADDRVALGLNQNGIDLNDNNRDYRIKRNNMMSFLTVGEVKQGMGVNLYTDNIHSGAFYSGAQNHHIGEITQLGTDGRRYVFGLPAYNHFQEDVSFAVGKKTNGDNGFTPADYYKGLVTYGSGAAGTGNDYGRDNYYSSEKTPAYAHSFLLTSVLSDDYADSDGTKGPSVDDMGSYVKLSYDKVENYQWRTPIAASQAYFNEGLKTDEKDDKASFVHGEKDLWYVQKIETKNYIAIFEFDNRKDAGSASGRDGGVNNSLAMKCLKKISLYARPDYIANPTTAIPIQQVHFEYDYELCQSFPGNTSPITAENQGGKLTLKKIWFSYQNSNRTKRSAYTFDYGFNPSYNQKAVDRWGNYMAVSSQSYSAYNSVSSPLSSADFPYTNQDPAVTNVNAAAWCLEYINLPSGGRIKVEYESDDYAFVQHLPAAQMFQIVKTEGNSLTADGSYDLQYVSKDGTSTNDDKNKPIYFKMKAGHTDPLEYVKPGQQLYFRCLVEMRENESNSSKTKYEYVSGYARVISVSLDNSTGTPLGRIVLDPEKLKDGGNAHYSPITKAAIQFGRLQLSSFIYDQPGSSDVNDSENSIYGFASSVINALGSFSELFTGPNMAVYNKDRGVKIVTNKSFIRLTEPTGRKLGGGSRVKSIRMSDNWDYMLNDNSPSTDYSYEYGQEFEYKTLENTSSGVASYEPMIGGDENPWHKPITYNNEKRFSIDDKLYQEEPVMESQFPSPTVGYSRITIKDLQRDNVTRHATGKIVKEFYTAREFPTFVHKTSLDIKTANSFLPVVPKYQVLTASQGFSIELNDMHGKPRKESVYAEGQTDPNSTVDYFYQSEPLTLDGYPVNRLTNNVTVINSNGTTETAQIGVKYEGTADFRESTTDSYGGSAQLGVNGFILGIIPIAVPSIWPKVDISYNRFRSATMNKVTNRFAILKRTLANQDGSEVETNNLAYDAETGEVLSTQTTTNFNDKVYTMNYPAFWKYDGMGLAYKNIGYSYSGASANANGFVAIPPAANFFTEGDEVIVTTNTSTTKAWVLSAVASGIVLADKTGAPVTGSGLRIKVSRSGRRNKQSVSMASLTSLENPVTALAANSYSKVLNAGAVEFKQDWQTSCNCFAGPTATSNLYVRGSKGNWRAVSSFTYLSDRTQSSYDGNSNVRQDGVFTSYSPYYKLQGGKWIENAQNWTFVSEVMQFSPNGMTLETRDALGRYSSSLFGFNSTLTTAVAANTKKKQLVYAGFEDAGFNNCSDLQPFAQLSTSVVNTQAHTGRKSLRVAPGATLQMSGTQTSCEKICLLSISGMSIVNGTAPFQMNVQIISGTGDINLTGTQLIPTYETGTRFEALIKVTDANDCEAVYTYIYDPNQL